MSLRASHPSSSPGRRICVIGTSGSGKTYVARALASVLGLRYISCDALIWAAEWPPVPRERQYEAFERETRDGEWTFDGNLGPSPEDQLVLSRCDTLIWLDLPRWQVMASITWRTLRRAATRERLWHGNVERWRTVFSRDSMMPGRGARTLAGGGSTRRSSPSRRVRTGRASGCAAAAR